MPTRFQSFADVEEGVVEYAELAGMTIGKDVTIDRTVDLAQFIGNPQNDLKVIHVAGTSGKTSTCYYISALLESSGSKVGLTVSPHIKTIAERVQINGKPLDETVFCNYFEDYMKLIKSWHDKPTYYELMMCFALWVFAKEKVDYAVIETGLGGLHDSSNICRRTDKLCVITDIGMDHMHVLGNTLGEISAQKAGIIAHKNKVITYEQAPEIIKPIISAVKRFDADLHIEKVPQTEDFREKNFVLAFKAFEVIQARDKLPILSEKNIDHARLTEVPGRLIVYQEKDSTIVVDGAHNDQKSEALVKALRLNYPNTKFALVLSMREGKEYARVVSNLSEIVSKAITTQFRLFQDAPLKSIDPGVLQLELEAQGIMTRKSSDLLTAVETFQKEKEPYILVTGSLYAASELLKG